MQRSREEIMPGVWLTALTTDKFKTDILSVSLLSELSRETAAMNAAIPSVLRRGTMRLPDLMSVSTELDELYGATASPFVRRYGEIQASGFFTTFAGDRYVPGGERLLEKACDFTGELLLSPVTRGGLFLPEYVESEKEKLLDRLRARKNDKNSYAVQRLIENMCAFENFAVSAYGDEDTADAIHYQKLSRHYKELVAKSPVEIFYCGVAEPGHIRGALKRTLAVMARGELDFDIGTDVRMNSVEAAPRYFEERMDVTQGKLSIGWRLGECMEEPDMAALRVFNAVFGGSVTSKLFANVRERLQLCYYASSSIDVHKGLLIVSSGIEFDQFGAARDEIFAQLDAIKRGEVTDEELEYAKKSVASGYRSMQDNPFSLESYWLGNVLTGYDCAPDELAALVESVTKDEIVAIANSVECDAVYFLRGGEGDDE